MRAHRRSLSCSGCRRHVATRGGLAAAAIVAWPADGLHEQLNEQSTTGASVTPAGSTTDTSGMPAPVTVDTTSGRLHGLARSWAREFLGVR